MDSVRRWELWGLLILSLAGIAFSLLFIPAALVFSVSLGASGNLRLFTILLALGLGSLSFPVVLGNAARFSLQRLQGRKQENILRLRFSWRVLAGLTVVWGGSVLLGQYFSQQESASLVLTGLFHLPAVFLPVIITLMWATGGLDLGTPLRTWGVLAVGALFVPLLSSLFELMIVLAAAMVAWVGLLNRPDLLKEIILLGRTVSATGMDAARLQTFLQTYPQVNWLLLAYFALLIPLTEELLKPLALWMLGRRLQSEAQGFALGALSGAIFAWYENLMAGSSSLAGDWVGSVLVRALTPAVHILSSALVGWGIAKWQREGRWQGFASRFALALFLHGAWNGLAIWMSLLQLGGTQTETPYAHFVGIGVAFIVLYLVAMFALRWLNARWRRLQPEQGEGPVEISVSQGEE